eukprot:4983198-Prymnesium_polylepis.1
MPQNDRTSTSPHGPSPCLNRHRTENGVNRRWSAEAERTRCDVACIVAIVRGPAARAAPVRRAQSRGRPGSVAASGDLPACAHREKSIPRDMRRDRRVHVGPRSTARDRVTGDPRSGARHTVRP